jgi:hypothetical protein
LLFLPRASAVIFFKRSMLPGLSTPAIASSIHFWCNFPFVLAFVAMFPGVLRLCGFALKVFLTLTLFMVDSQIANGKL